ncbi:MAG: hypothetical protein HYZ83_02035 [Candidatus Omnitrophica bacterium]|nr:hypothetical protein [Candidatus Omnitrophota bacterium]
MKVFYFALGVFLLVILPVFSGVLIYHKIQQNMKVRIEGNFIPFLVIPGFQVRSAHFVWNGKVELVSGNLNVHYRLSSFLPFSRLRIRVEGKALKVKLLGDWAVSQGIEDIDLDFFYADLGLTKQGMREIYGIEAMSPKFQFRIKKSETLMSERTRDKELAA